MKRTRSTAPLNIVSGMVLTCIMLACCSAALALDPALDVSQYAHAAWKIDDGFANSEITAIAQTPDGYLWLGTELGLYRFDGLKNVQWHPPADQELPANWIFSLLASRDGTLWIGTYKGLASWKNGKLTQYPQLAGLYIFKILEDREGTVWASGLALTGGKLCAIRSGSVQCSGDDGTLGRGAFGLYEDSKGNLWAGVKDGLWRWKPGPPKFYPLDEEPDGIQSLTEDSDGTLLVGLNGSIHRFVDGNARPYQFPGSMDQLNIRRILRDRHGALWVGTGRGLLHVHQGKADRFTVADGLSGATVTAMFEDREGTIWVATSGGLDRFHEFAVATYSINQGLMGDLVFSVLADRDGSILVAGRDGLNKWSDQQIKTIGPAGGQLSRLNVNSLFQDSGGRVWLSTPFQLGYLNNNEFVLLIDIPGAITSMAQDTAGNLWIANEHVGLFQVLGERLGETIPWSKLGSNGHASILAADALHGGLWIGFFLGGVAYLKDGHIQALYTTKEGLAPGRVSDFLQDQDGTLWIATEGGLSRLRGGRITTLTSKNGLPCDAVHWVREDNAHAFWFYTSCGLVRVARAELEALASAVDQDINTRRRIAATIFDSSDGVKSIASGNHFNPQVAKSADGRLWFVASDGVGSVDPAHLPFNNLPPPVWIEGFVADRKVYDATSDDGTPLALPPLIRDLQIDYTALSLIAPEKILYRYMLEGRDTAWQEAGNRRQAFYTDLPPGNYRFRLKACNNSGIWNEAGTFIDFSIAPAYYQTTWFRVLFVAGVLLLLATLYQLRVRQVAAQVRARLEERVEERERIARDLHDTLLQSVQGLILSVDAAAQQIPPDQPAHRDLEKTLDRADEVVTEARDRVRDLRSSSVPFGGLPAAFQEVVEEISNGRDTTFKTVVEGNVRKLHPVIQEEAYRIGREALINALTHSEGHNIEVEIAYDSRQFRLRVRDDGRGFDPGILKEGGRPNHWGLPGMRERAERIGAELKIWSRHQTGTEIELSVPGAMAYQTDRSSVKNSWIRRLLGKTQINAGPEDQ